MVMILDQNESLDQAKRLLDQRESDHAVLAERLQDSREALVRYQILLAQLKETLARG
jgi:hypothetical protein